MIVLQFIDGSDQRVVAMLKSRGPAIREQLTDELDTQMLALQRRVQHKLAGEVLVNRSGKALGSVNKSPVEASEDKLFGRVTAGGGPAWYLQVHEYGGSRTYDIVPRTKKALAFFPGGSVGGSISSGFGSFRPGAPTVRALTTRSGANRGSLRKESLGTFGQLGGVVVAKVVHPPLPKRPFMTTSLEEMRTQIIDRLRAAVARGIREGA